MPPPRFASPRWISPLVAAVLLCLSSKVSAGALPAEVEHVLRQAQLPTDALAVVVEEVGGKARLAQNAEGAMNPASLTKLLTTYAALDLLGPAWSWKTPVWLQGPLHNGVLDGSVVIQGTGDPKLTLERLWLLMRRIRQLGVREIRGDIVLDRSAFAVPESHPGDFDNEPMRPYNVLPDALMLNYKSVVYTFMPDAARGMAVVSADPPLAGVAVDPAVPLTNAVCQDWRSALKASVTANRVRFAGGYAASCGERVWPMAYADPTGFNARAIEGMWRELGGKLGGSVRDGPAPTTQKPTFELMSPPLAEVVRDINKFSNNTMAQQLFFTLALTQRGAPATQSAAREVLRQWLADRFGEQAVVGVVIDNGSGLSRDTRVSAQLLARVLQSAWASPVMPELLASLPVTGLDGTMRRSLAPTGRGHLKTGSLRDVLGVAGYVLGDSGRRYVVVALINHPQAGAAHPAVDALVQWAMRDGARP